MARPLVMMALRLRNSMSKGVAILLVLLWAMVCLKIAMANESFAARYAEGQLWTFSARPTEEGATLLINRIEQDPRLGPIFHISVFDVRVANPHAPGGVTAALPHFPVSRETLDKSCLELRGIREPNPDYLEGYREWRGVFDAGRAGVFDIPVSEIVDIVQTAIARQTAQ